MKKYVSLIILLAFFVAKPINAQQLKHVQLQQHRTQQSKNAATEKLAISYYRSGDYEKSAELFGQLYDENPTRYYYQYFFNSLVKLKEYDVAEKLVKKQKRRAGNYRNDIDLAYLYNVSGQKKKAIKTLDKIIKKVPDNRNQVSQLASALRSRGFYGDAIKVMEESSEKNGYDFELEIAGAYQMLGNYPMMFESYLNHLEKRPQDVQLVKSRMQMMLRFDVDESMNRTLKQKLLLKTRENPDNLVYADLLLWHSMQSKDFEMAFMQAAALDRRTGNSEGILLEVAEISLANKDFETAAKSYKFLMDNHKDGPFYSESYCGYYDALVSKEIENSEANSKTWKKLQKTGEKALKELGVNASSASISRQLGYIIAFKEFEYDQAKNILETALAVPNIGMEEKSKIKLELADILVLQNHVWDASLLYSQIEADMKYESIGHEAKFRNARLFYYEGEYQWSLTRLDILKSATSKLIANNAMELSMFISTMLEEDTLGFTLDKFARADLFTYRQQYDSAIVFLDRIADFPSGPVSLEYQAYRKARVVEQSGDYINADSLYQQMWTNFPGSVKADNAIFHQAELNRLKLGDKQKAMELYFKIMKEHPDSIYAGEARLRYREMREE